MNYSHFIVLLTMIFYFFFLCISENLIHGTKGYLTHTQEYGQKLNNVTDIIKYLLSDYDMRLRPNFGGQALKIEMDISIASFDSISEVNMDYTLTLYLNQLWKDERLSFGHDSSVYLTLTGDFADRIWVPDTFFANDKNSFLHEVTEKNKMVRLYADGRISYGMRFTTTLACMMDLHYYPLDYQNCSVEIESYGYTISDVLMAWAPTAVVGVEEAKMPQFSIVKYWVTDRSEKLATGIYQRLSLMFRLKRNIGYFLFQTYLPSILIVMLSWVSFWINHEATSARVTLGMTTVLTMTTISTGVRSSLPRISYIKAIDIYLVMCFVFVFAALLEYAAVNYTYWGARAKRKSKRVSHNIDLAIKAQNKELQEIFELEEFRHLSPNLRNRSALNGNRVCPRNVEYPIQLSNKIYTNLGPRKYYRGQKPKQKVLQTLTRGGFKIPKIKNVNKIDKYSRVVFPVAFIAFNGIYWSVFIQ